MDQKKTGSFLKSLRNEKRITQEQLAEQFGVSNRSVSRWETGSNMPDISLLVELADFYDVDVREIINGARKSEDMNEEVREVAEVMAEYANQEKGNLLTWVRRIGIGGTICSLIAIIIQSVRYTPDIGNAILFFLSIIIFVAMASTALYTNGLLEKMTKNKKIVLATKIVVFTLVVVATKFITSVILVLLMAVVEITGPVEKRSGIESYDKQYYLENYSHDFGSQMRIFPDDTANMINPTFEARTHEGMFDSDAYLVLQTSYSKEEYEAEAKRLSEISVTIEDHGSDMSVTNDIIYDTKEFAYPAYVASDGNCDMYEYALLDSEKYEITYVLINYPDSSVLPAKYLRYTKPEMFLPIDRACEEYSIYCTTFDGGEIYTVVTVDEL